MKENQYDNKSEECKRVLLILLEALYHRGKLEDTEYQRAVELIVNGEYV